MKPIKQVYDWAAKDFGTIALRCGDYFKKAEKSHEIGEGVVASALKSGIFKLYDSDEAQKLATEFEGLSNTIDKRKAKDDLIDALRYALVSIPIDWAKVLDKNAGIQENLNKRAVQYETKQDKLFAEARPSSYMAMGVSNEYAEEEIEYYNDLY